MSKFLESEEKAEVNKKEDVSSQQSSLNLEIMEVDMVSPSFRKKDTGNVWIV